MPADESKPRAEEVIAERYGKVVPTFEHLIDVDLVIAQMVMIEDAALPLQGAEAVAARAIIALSRAGSATIRDARHMTYRRAAQDMLTRANTQLDDARTLMTDLITARTR